MLQPKVANRWWADLISGGGRCYLTASLTKWYPWLGYRWGMSMLQLDAMEEKLRVNMQIIGGGSGRETGSRIKRTLFPPF